MRVCQSWVYVCVCGAGGGGGQKTHRDGRVQARQICVDVEFGQVVAAHIGSCRVRFYVSDWPRACATGQVLNYRTTSRNMMRLCKKLALKRLCIIEDSAVDVTRLRLVFSAGVRTPDEEVDVSALDTVYDLLLVRASRGGGVFVRCPTHIRYYTCVCVSFSASLSCVPVRAYSRARACAAHGGGPVRAEAAPPGRLPYGHGAGAHEREVVARVVPVAAGADPGPEEAHRSPRARRARGAAAGRTGACTWQWLLSGGAAVTVLYRADECMMLAHTVPISSA